MKKFFYTFTLLLFVQLCVAQKKEHVKKYQNGKVAEKGFYDENGEETGLWHYYFEDGNASAEINYIAGKKHGRAKEYYKSRQLKSNVKYVNGTTGSGTSYYENGQLHKKTSIKNNRKDGKSVYYYPDGKLAVQEEFDNGIMIGIHESYYENGQLRYRYKYDKNGNQLYHEAYYEDGRVQVKTVKEGQNTVTTTYDTGGTVTDKHIFKNDKLILSEKYISGQVVKQQVTYEYDAAGKAEYTVEKQYTNSGALAVQKRFNYFAPESEVLYNDSTTAYYTYAKGKKATFFEVYNNSGQIATVGKYLSGSKAGVWKTYYSNGQLKFSGKFIPTHVPGNEQKDGIHAYFYSNGVPEKTEEYYMEHNPKVAVDFYKSQPKGVWKTFYNTGRLKSLTTYEDNRKNGTYESYYANGTPEEQAGYKDGFLYGHYASYYENGKPYIIGSYGFLGKEGLVKEYYENGALKSEIVYKDGEKNGLAREYYENGVLKKEGLYFYNREDSDVWKFYYQNKNLAQKLEYLDGHKIINLFYPSGIKMVVMDIDLLKKNDLSNIHLYNEKGKAVSFSQFIGSHDAELQKIFFEYESNDGIINLIIYYIESGEEKSVTKNYKG